MTMATERLDAAWEAATEEANSQAIASSPLLPSPCNDAHDDGSSSTSPPLQKSSLEYDDDNTGTQQLNGSSSNLLYEYDDPFLLFPSNDTSPTSIMQSSSLSAAATSSNENDSSLLSRYRTFLQRNDTLLSLIELLMERFLFYGHLFKSHHHNDNNNNDYERGILRTEMYYAAWNVIRWMNDVVLVGGGGGMGLTVGTREEWLSSVTTSDGNVMSSNSNNDGGIIGGLSLNQWISIKLERLIPIIRATITATTCIYPAVEAFSRRSIIHKYRGENDDWERRKYRAALVSYRLERIRFMGRMCLLVISWWARLQRKRQQQQQQKQSQNRNDDGYYLNNSNVYVPSILQRGGELDPYEELVPLKDAEDEANVVQYVGRRTGRRSIISNAHPKLGPPSSTIILSNIPIISKATNNLMGWISKLLASSSVNKVAYVYAVGEILHIVRPLYWSRAQTSEWKRRQQQQRNNRGRVSNSWSIWKAWWFSLFMDLISDKLLRLTSGGGEDAVSRNNRQGVRRRGSSFMGRRGGKQSTQQQNYQSYSYSAPSSAEEAKLVELDWRRSRHGLYLLRSPMYDVVTRPIASFLARVVSMIPSMGLGRWAAEYVLDMMSYWNDNHFMLES